MKGYIHIKEPDLSGYEVIRKTLTVSEFIDQYRCPFWSVEKIDYTWEKSKILLFRRNGWTLTDMFVIVKDDTKKMEKLFGLSDMLREKKETGVYPLFTYSWWEH